MALRTPKVLVTILHQGYIRPELGVLAAKMREDKRVELDVLFLNRRPAEDARNGSVSNMLNGGYDYLITIDHDIVPIQNPLDLVFLNLDVVGCACPQLNMSCPEYPIYLVGMDIAEGGYKEHKDKKGLQKVDAVGSGCLVMSRKVLEAIKAPFMREWDENGMSKSGLDFFFCRKAKEKGFDVYCNYDYLCDHFKEVSLLSMLEFKHA